MLTKSSTAMNGQNSITQLSAPGAVDVPTSTTVTLQTGQPLDVNAGAPTYKPWDRVTNVNSPSNTSSEAYENLAQDCKKALETVCDPKTESIVKVQTLTMLRRRAIQMRFELTTKQNTALTAVLEDLRAMYEQLVEEEYLRGR
ncbi:MAG: hypothetical protein R3C68_10145 [Myxococcota bacterium]